MKEGFERITVDTLGGLCTLMERSDLPLGLSPRVQNVEFFPGGFRTRDAFKSYLTYSVPNGGHAKAVYEYFDGTGNKWHIAYTSDGGDVIALDPDGGGGYTSVIGNTGAFWGRDFTTMRATSLYGKVYACLSDGIRGVAPPFQWNGVTTARPIAATGPVAPALTSAAAGTMTDGRYYVIASFETESGFITGTTQLNYVDLTSGGISKIAATAIPIGPLGTSKRRLFVSLVDSFELFNPPALIINDNTTTSLTFNLSQAEIAAGLPFEGYIALQTPTAHLGVESYSNRLVMWGGDGKINPFLGPTTTSITPPYSSIGLINLDFSGNTATSYNWAVPGSYSEWYGASGNAAVSPPWFVAGQLGNYLTLTSLGPGSAPMVQQGYGAPGVSLRMNHDALGNYYLVPGRKYGIRASARCANTAVGGSLVIALYETVSLASRTKVAELEIPISSMLPPTSGPGWHIHESDGTVTVTAHDYVSMDVYYKDGTLGDVASISHIEVYDLETKRGGSVLDVSKAFDPESFDAVNGTIIVNPNDGQSIRNVFSLRGNMYICKEKSMYVTQDSGQDPAFWSTEIVSSTVGTPSVHGVGLGDGWAVIVARDGLYLFDGGAPQKISQEIQPTWDEFDWTKGEQVFCIVNPVKQTIVIGGPSIGNGYQQLRLSYLSGFGDPVAGNGNGRAWSRDLHTARFYGGNMITLDDGSRTIAYAGGTTSLVSRIAYEAPQVYLDYDGKVIAATYETAPIGQDMERSLFGQLAVKIRGSDTVDLFYTKPDAAIVSLGSKTITPDMLHDVEKRLMIIQTQIGIVLQNNVDILLVPTGGYFKVKRIAVWLKPAPSAKLRGY